MNVKDSRGHTPIMITAKTQMRNEDASVVNIKNLIRAGANINEQVPQKDH